MRKGCVIGANINNSTLNNVLQKERHTMQLKGLKSNQLGKLPAVKNEIHKKGNPKSAIILFI